MSELPDGWLLAASTFNWTPEVIAADRPVEEIVVGIAGDGVAQIVELEAGQIWRGFPAPSVQEVGSLRTALAAAGGRVSIVGLSIDDYVSPDRRRTEDERFAFLLPQLHAAARVGASGVRLPLGQAGRRLVERVRPLLDDLDLVWYEEIQGQQSPDQPAVAAAIETIADFHDARVRLLCDLSMLMPALPPSYLDALRRGGVDEALVDRLEHDWSEPATADAVRTALRDGTVPPPVHTLFMNLVIRFGRSRVADLEPLLGLVGGLHLKFWDLDDTDGRISAPLAELAAVLVRRGFRGTLTSEWGGHEWLEGWDATETTRRHLQLAATALAGGAAA